VFPNILFYFEILDYVLTNIVSLRSRIDYDTRNAILEKFWSSALELRPIVPNAIFSNMAVTWKKYIKYLVRTILGLSWEENPSLHSPNKPALDVKKELVKTQGGSCLAGSIVNW
jgi:hypothetical protein